MTGCRGSCFAAALSLRQARNDFIEIRPWGATDAEVTLEAASADVLYLPLPFGDRFAAFTELSLPTKLVTYVGSGRPILYHGPPATATTRVLRAPTAALFVQQQDPIGLASALVRWIQTDAARCLRETRPRARPLTIPARATTAALLDSMLGARVLEDLKE